MRVVIISATILTSSSSAAYWQNLPAALTPIVESQKHWYTTVATQPHEDPYIPPSPKPVPKPPPFAPPPKVSGDRYDKVAQCESGMNQDAVSKDGLYLSYFQWLPSTWHAVGGAGDPRDHSYAEQKARAQSMSNPSSQWPVCWAKAG